jgi:hypothetical protein
LGEGFNALVILGKVFNALAVVGEGFNAQTISCASNNQIRVESTPLSLSRTNPSVVHIYSRSGEVWGLG